MLFLNRNNQPSRALGYSSALFRKLSGTLVEEVQLAHLWRLAPLDDWLNYLRRRECARFDSTGVALIETDRFGI